MLRYSKGGEGKIYNSCIYLQKIVKVTLREYIETEIIPRYDAFDGAHRRDHVEYVIDESLKLAEQIEIMAQAVEDHRASSNSEPRSIYGKIVAEAI